MSDFLDSLAARSLNVRPNLRPRLQPSFEANPFSPDEPTPTRVSPTARPIEETVRQMRTVTEETVERRSVMENHTSHIDHVTEVFRERTLESDLVAEPTKRYGSAPSPEVSAPREVSVKLMAESVKERSVVPPSALAPPASTLTQVLQILPERPATPPSALPSPPVKASPMVEVRQQEIAPREPDIEIHIGRVEVRAQFAAAPAKREEPKPKEPAMTLDKYLEGRR